MTPPDTRTPLIEVDGLTVTYPQGTRRPPFTALEGVALHLAEGETLGVVGASGSGKSTLGNAILGSVRPSAGTIRYRGEDITHATKARRRALTEELQVVFQDPNGSLNPARTIRQTLEEPLLAHRRGLPRTERRALIGDALDKVGLAASAADRYPTSFSGGQRQRIALARALMLQPAVVVCDEAVSALDLSVQAQVLNLLRSAQQGSGVSYLFISHDLGVVRHACDRVMVLWRGRVVESGDTDRIMDDPQHPYTQRLLAAGRP
jgi:peptide/nickel transport system ATP-binding protein